VEDLPVYKGAIEGVYNSIVMQIFKFGGASVKDAEAVRNVKNILEKYASGPIVVVISAMGKTTNALETVLNAWLKGEDAVTKLDIVRSYHLDILNELIPDLSNPIWGELSQIFSSLKDHVSKPSSIEYDAEYDYVVSYGEIISTKIISAYLNDSGFANQWIDAREYVITNDLHREARVDWDLTKKRIETSVQAITNTKPVITQGFIGSTKENITTTLGREGSDFTASIFAYCLDAEELVIWKDVPGILNADPKKFAETVKFNSLSYQDAVEMTYYGATVLHPKTIKPLQNKNIQLRVRSFLQPELDGTTIGGGNDIPESDQSPIIILKENQSLISLSTKDYSFIAEEAIEQIFDEVVRYGIKVNVMHNSAISFQICVDERPGSSEDFSKVLEKEFEISKVSGLELLTVKYPSETILNRLLTDKKILLEMRSGDTVQFVLK
jgi:aspartate kinase